MTAIPPVFCPWATEAGLVGAELRVGRTARKHEAALELAGLSSLTRVVVTVVVMVSPADFRREVRKAAGEYVLAATENSLGPGRVDAERLLTLGRGHWGIESGLSHVRGEVSLDRDACRVLSNIAFCSWPQLEAWTWPHFALRGARAWSPRVAGSSCTEGGVTASRRGT